jgi:undecaprenyl diphosphate synthase
VRVRVIGERSDLQPDIADLLREAESLTALNREMNLVIAFNYGSRDEIVRAVRRAAEAVAAGSLRAGEITEERFSALLDTAGIPDPDLVIRTSGEQRLSNFLLWQAAYAELVFAPCYWPDFDSDDLDTALEAFHARERRFGGLVDRDAS